MNDHDETLRRARALELFHEADVERAMTMAESLGTYLEKAQSNLFFPGEWVAMMFARGPGVAAWAVEHCKETETLEVLCGRAKLGAQRRAALKKNPYLNEAGRAKLTVTNRPGVPFKNVVGDEVTLRMEKMLARGDGLKPVAHRDVFLLLSRLDETVRGEYVDRCVRESARADDTWMVQGILAYHYFQEDSENVYGHCSIGPVEALGLLSAHEAPRCAASFVGRAMSPLTTVVQKIDDVVLDWALEGNAPSLRDMRPHTEWLAAGSFARVLSEPRWWRALSLEILEDSEVERMIESTLSAGHITELPVLIQKPVHYRWARRFLSAIDVVCDDYIDPDEYGIDHFVAAILAEENEQVFAMMLAHLNAYQARALLTGMLFSGERDDEMVLVAPGAVPELVARVEAAHKADGEEFELGSILRDISERNLPEVYLTAVLWATPGGVVLIEEEYAEFYGTIGSIAYRSLSGTAMGYERSVRLLLSQRDASLGEIVSAANALSAE